VQRALPLLGPAPFVLVNADVHSCFPFDNLRKPPAGLAHLVLVDNPQHNPAGDFALQADGRLANQGEQMLTFAGISLLEPRLFAGSPGDTFSLVPLLRAAAEAGDLSGEHYRGRWLDVGTPQRLAQAQRPS
jgi:N-acetyl-alpha-D-muramate 1-phosphate uridylyltransferase